MKRINAYTKKQLERLRIVDKEYQKMARRNKPHILQGKRKYEIENPEKHKAGSILRNAVYRGKIKKGNCRDCGKSNAQGHHPDYSKPLEVIWLCPSHHKLEDLKKVEKKCICSEE